MKNLQVSNTSNLAIVDDEDFDRLSTFKWSFWNGVVGRHEKIHSVTKHTSLASAVMQSNFMFDHKDRNPFNNTKENL